jgi:hypothetical protein
VVATGVEACTHAYPNKQCIDVHKPSSSNVVGEEDVQATGFGKTVVPGSRQLSNLVHMEDPMWNFSSQSPVREPVVVPSPLVSVAGNVGPSVAPQIPSAVVTVLKKGKFIAADAKLRLPAGIPILLPDDVVSLKKTPDVHDDACADDASAPVCAPTDPPASSGPSVATSVAVSAAAPIAPVPASAAASIAPVAAPGPGDLFHVFEDAIPLSWSSSPIIGKRRNEPQVFF